MKNIVNLVRLAGIVLAVMQMLWVRTTNAQNPQREEITVIAPYDPTLPEVSRINIQPKIEPQTSSLPPMDISITPVDFFITHNIESIQEAPPPAEKQDEIFRNHIRGGFGNYLTPYLELNVGTLRNPNHMLNVQFRHLSSNGKIRDYGPSAFSENMLRVAGKKFFDKLTLGAEASYDRNVVHHYGFLKADFPDSIYNTSKRALRQRFTETGFALSVQSNNKEPEGFHYNARFGYDAIADLFETSGHRLGFSTQISKAYQLFKTKDKQSMGLNLGVDNYRNTDSLKTWNNALIQLQPYLRFKYQEYEGRIGLGMAFDHDTATHFRIFPFVEGRLQLVQNRLALFAGLDGKVVPNSFQSLVKENPFLHSTPEYRNSLHKLRFYGGMQSSIGKHLDLTLSVSNTVIDNMPLFVNDTVAPFNRFNVVYDGLNIVNGKLSATVAVSQQLRLTTGFDFFSYSTDLEARAWHLPAFKTYLEGWYNYSEKISIRGSAHANGKAWAKVWDSDARLFTEKELRPWLDFSFGATYRFTDQLHFFLDARNISAGRQYHWYNYPSQRVNFMAGAGFSF